MVRPTNGVKTMPKHKITIELDSELIEHVVDGKTYQTDLTKVSNAGLAYVLRYGWQRAHNDRCGALSLSSEDKITKQADVNKRIIEGTITERSSGGPADPLGSIRKYIREIIRRAMSDKQKAAYKTADDKNAFVDKLFESQAEPIRNKIIERATAMREAARTELDLE